MRWLLIGAAAVALSGCGIPPAMTVASLAADIVSYGSTGKTVTDHGLSMALREDCALLRVLDGPICIAESEAETIATRGSAGDEDSPDRLDVAGYLGDTLRPRGETRGRRPWRDARYLTHGIVLGPGVGRETSG